MYVSAIEHVTYFLIETPDGLRFSCKHASSSPVRASKTSTQSYIMLNSSSLFAVALPYPCMYSCEGNIEFCFQRLLRCKVVGSGTNLKAKDGNRGEVLQIVHQFHINQLTFKLSDAVCWLVGYLYLHHKRSNLILAQILP